MICLWGAITEWVSVDARDASLGIQILRRKISGAHSPFDSAAGADQNGSEDMLRLERYRWRMDQFGLDVDLGKIAHVVWK